jgi:hypothetical protein
MKRLRSSLDRTGEAGVSPLRNPRRIASPGLLPRRLTSSGGGIPRPPRRLHRLAATSLWLRVMRRGLLAAACVVLVGAGCGVEEGVGEHATASVYVALPLCAGAKRELARDGGRAGDVRVRVVCLPRAESSRRLELATIGANARRASEDSTTVGYIGEPTRAASRFSEPILESAGIAQLTETSGAAGMKKLLHAVAEAGDSGSLRESVRNELE